MKLHEIIEANLTDDSAILVEEILKYKKQLYTYYKDSFISEPVLMVVSVMNAAQYAKIVPADELTECIGNYIGDSGCGDEESENYSEYETICANSMLLKDILTTY